MIKEETYLFGMEEMTILEQTNTNGGSITVFLICAASALLLSGCMGCTSRIFDVEYNEGYNALMKNYDKTNQNDSIQ